ncbi:WGxxGxxG family protein [Bacillus sp. JCM 19041]|uniref:WGxxGxxG family protein n=1 Tax=Bacillus sp. JCM 19041 TaxID=1460637 RepID=UPI0006D0CEFC
MKKKLSLVLCTITIATVLSTQAADAREYNNNQPASQNFNTAQTDDGNNNWGWIGLVGFSGSSWP